MPGLRRPIARPLASGMSGNADRPVTVHGPALLSARTRLHNTSMPPATASEAIAYVPSFQARAAVGVGVVTSGTDYCRALTAISSGNVPVAEIALMKEAAMLVMQAIGQRVA